MRVWKIRTIYSIKYIYAQFCVNRKSLPYQFLSSSERVGARSFAIRETMRYARDAYKSASKRCRRNDEGAKTYLGIKWRACQSSIVQSCHQQPVLGVGVHGRIIVRGNRKRWRWRGVVSSEGHASPVKPFPIPAKILDAFPNFHVRRLYFILRCIVQRWAAINLAIAIRR